MLRADENAFLHTANHCAVWPSRRRGR